MFRIMCKLTFVYIFLFILFPLFASPIIHLQKNKGKITIGKSIEILEDKTGELSFEEILSDKKSRAFQKSIYEYYNIGFSNSIYWIK
ncbi:MAG: hypothetical protein KDK45_11225, partial [Leptospiraceae bacterium]|nr:hypothetical protein [Leptospiraceae bacterium]